MMDIVTVPQGWFWMGSSDHYPWEKPRHRVWLDCFAIACTPVTRLEYSLFLTETQQPEPAGWLDTAFQDPAQPVVGVSWFDAVAYCNWLSESRKETYRLPSEAEWEKACRGNLEDSDYAWGSEAPNAIDYFAGQWIAPKPVGQWRANGYGLFNM